MNTPNTRTAVSTVRTGGHWCRIARLGAYGWHGLFLLLIAADERLI